MVAPESRMETVMMIQTRARRFLTVAAAVVIAALAAGGLVKWSMFATNAAAIDRAGVGIFPFDIMLKTDMKKLPFEQFKDGECPDRC
jgi:5,10-methylene-tetrahydrofolate dehydrogenase/methenyl tetrahydrofolate cyclohydrolase